jgi:hypothetical protein
VLAMHYPLAYNGLDDRAADILAGCKALSNLKTLDVYGSHLSQEAIAKIKTSPHLPNLHALQVDW